jgi:SAM-dependent methyltransferase
LGYSNKSFKIKEKKMEIEKKEEIKQAVRESYGKVAKNERVAFGTSPAASCCSPSEISAEAGQAETCDCVPPGVSAQQISTIMGYSKEDLASVPEGANMGLGCGNPVALASLKPGETVVDLGSGGGFDCFLAARQVADTGRVIGVDMTPDMVSKARKNAEKMEMNNVEFRLGEDNTADIIMSNCVINLSPDKTAVYREAFRVLKPGGRLAISDVLATAPLPDAIQKDLALVAACVGGAATIDDTVKLLEQVGFQDINIRPNDDSRELIRQWDPTKSENAADYVVSAYIEAIKPS